MGSSMPSMIGKVPEALRFGVGGGVGVCRGVEVGEGCAVADGEGDGDGDGDGEGGGRR